MSRKLRTFYVTAAGTALGIAALALMFLAAVPSTWYHQ